MKREDEELVSLWFNKRLFDIADIDAPRVSAHEVVKPESVETQSSFELLVQNDIYYYTVNNGEVVRELVSNSEPRRVWDSPQEREKALNSGDVSTNQYPRYGDGDANLSPGDPGCFYKFTECNSIDWSCLVGMIGGNIVAIAGCAACVFSPEPLSKSMACGLCLADFTFTQISNFGCYTSPNPAQDDCSSHYRYILAEEIEQNQYLSWNDCDMN